VSETRAPSLRRRALRAIAFAAATVTAATYGFFFHRDHIFPYRVVRSAFRTEVPLGRQLQHWFPARRPATPVSDESIKQLANLPYLRGYQPATTSGVLVNDRRRALDGLNFYTSGHAPVATLVDMDGSLLKTWTADAYKAFPGLVLSGAERDNTTFFRCARLLPDGGILALFEQVGLVRLDASSRVLWAFRARTHHDFFVTPGGEIFVLSRELRLIPELRPKEPVWEDFVTELAPDGRFVRKVSILEAFRRSTYAPLLARVWPWPDIFHTNSLEVFDGSLAERSPLFRKGNVLLSMRHTDVVAILDLSEDRIVWALTGQWRMQHAAGLLENGHLLLFDNLGTMREASRVLEVEPFTQEVVWQYGDAPGEDLYSRTSGSVRRLPNGDSLVTESNYGRALEIAPDHRVVWEFVNPNRAGEKGELVATLCMLDRVPRNLPFLVGKGTSAASSTTPPR
jgi:hypothetical protein